jgi:uncharacterized membrane protein
VAVQMKYGDYIKGGLDIVKANLVPSIVLPVLMCVPLVGLAGPIFIVNYMAAVKAAKHEGKPMEIGLFFNFENAVDKWVGLFLCGLLTQIGMMLLFIPGLIVAGVTFFTAPILADKPGTPFMSAIKASVAFGKANLVPMILVALVLGIFQMLGVIACFVGMFITMPVAVAGAYLAYEDHKSAVEAAAATDGVKL